MSPHTVGGARCPAYGVSERYSKDIICTIIQAKWYYFQMSLMNDLSIQRIEWARLTGTRPRNAGCNSRLGEHGTQVRPGIARVTADNGASGFGWSSLTKEHAESLIGFQLSEMFDPERGVDKRFRAFEYPIWDLAGQLAEKPVYALLGGQPDNEGVFRVPCTIPRCILMTFAWKTTMRPQH